MYKQFQYKIKKCEPILIGPDVGDVGAPHGIWTYNPETGTFSENF